MKPLILTIALAAAFLPLLFKPGNKKKFALSWLSSALGIFVFSLFVPFVFPVGNDLRTEFPLVPGLDEYIHLFPIHISLAWGAVAAFVSSFVFACIYLKKRTASSDRLSYCSNLLGIIFCSLATIIGTVWAKHSWGTYWNWDPREISVVFMLLIYIAYFLLRSSLGKTTMTAKGLSAGYSVMAGIAMPFFMFILPRTVSGLHPMSGGSFLDSAPLLGSFALSLFASTNLIVSLLYFLNLRKK